jgi:integrase
MKTDSESKATRDEPEFQKVAECLYRHTGSSIYYGLVKRGGKQIRKSFKTTDRKIAERHLATFREQVARLSRVEGIGKISFKRLAERWLETIRYALKPSSLRRRETSIVQLNRHFGSLPVRNITAQTCDEWIAKRAGTRSASTFNNERETLRAILDYAQREGLILNNPAQAIKRRRLQKKEIVIPTRDQFSKLIKGIRDLDVRARDAADLIELLAYSGVRLGEATAMLWQHIDFARGSFTVTGGEEGTKNHEARSVPLFPALKQLLERLIQERSPQPKDRIIRIDTAKKAMASACKDQSLPHFTHHAMRHYFASNAIEQGIDFKTIAGWLGHKDGGILVAQTYGHLRDIHSFEMAKRMTFTATPNE